jgi:hypothetical protein
MAHSYHHAVSSARKWGGKPEDYQAIHDYLDVIWTRKPFLPPSGERLAIAGDPPSRPAFLGGHVSQVRLERRFSGPACDLTQRRAHRLSREARSRAEPRAAASLRRAWRAR